MQEQKNNSQFYQRGRRLRRQTRRRSLNFSVVVFYFFIFFFENTNMNNCVSKCLSLIQGRVGGILATPCLCNSVKTLSIDGGFNPRGSGSHGFAKTSPIAASKLSFDCIKKKQKQIQECELG